MLVKRSKISNSFSFTRSLEAVCKIRLQSTQWFQRRCRLKLLMDDDDVLEIVVHLAVACDVYDGVFFPRGVFDEILNLIESVSEGFPSYSLPNMGMTAIFNFVSWPF